MLAVKQLILKMAKVPSSPVSPITAIPRAFTVAVEGNIGSGKTTFLNHFNKYDSVAVFAEPIDLWRDCNGYNLLVSTDFKMLFY